MNYRKFIIAGFLTVNCQLSIFSLNAQKFSLSDCISIGLENNFQIKTVRNAQRISDNNFTAGNAGMLPTLDLSAGYQGTLNDVTQSPADESAKIINNGVNNSTLNAGVSLNWTVFDGLQMFASYARLKELKQAGELNSQLAVENFIALLAGEYYNLVQQNIQYQNLHSAVRLSKERLRIVEARYQIGSMSRLDLQQAKVDFNADSSRLIKHQEILFASRVKINQMLGQQNVTHLEKWDDLQPVDTSIVFNALLNRDELWNETEQKNTVLRLAQSDKTLSIIDLQAVQSKNYPYVRLTAGYGYTENRYSHNLNRQQNSLGMNYGVTLGFNIFDGLNRSREQKNAKIAIENKNLQFQEVLLSLRSDFANMWMAYHNNIGLVRLEEENLESARENYDIAIERYKLGDLSGIELREAQNSLLGAEERFVQAQYAAKLCEISLLQISGNVKNLF